MLEVANSRGWRNQGQPWFMMTKESGLFSRTIVDHEETKPTHAQKLSKSCSTFILWSDNSSGPGDCFLGLFLCCWPDQLHKRYTSNPHKVQCSINYRVIISYSKRLVFKVEPFFKAAWVFATLGWLQLWKTDYSFRAQNPPKRLSVASSAPVWGVL